MKDKLAHRTYRKRALFQITKVLWHLDIFRRSFRELSGHSCMAESCIFCALKELFSQLQSSHESALPPDALRRALAESFFDQQRFQLGFMDDAAECFENMLLRIHYHIAEEEAEDMCGARHCIPHEKFAMTLVEQSVCGACGATSEPLPFTQMVHYVSASALTAQARQSTTPSHPDLFGLLLKKAGGMGDIRDCPSACGAKIQIRRTLMNRPEIVSVGVVWDSDRPSLEHIMAVLGTLRTSLRLSDVFHGCDNSASASPLHQLVGVVTYYGKHYSTFFFHTKLKVWIYFDDATVREVGPRWEQVVEKCRRGRYQPLLLLFAVPEGTPIDTSNAPKSITMATKAPLVPSPCKQPLAKQSSAPVLGGRRSLTPSPEKPSVGHLAQRRAVTPNPEQTNQEYIRAKTALMQTNEYQNLTLIQANIFPPSSPLPPQSSSSNSSPNLDFPLSNRKLVPERLTLQRRDSGNWSGDRNSASSSSSTSLENPYQYIVGKMQLRSHNGVPRSPTSIKPGELSSSSTGSNHGDAGYDSYSLSSTDSLPLQHLLKHNLQLAQIPEGHQTPTNLSSAQYSPTLLNQSAVDDCERLCAEADNLLGRSEEAQDLITALSYCNAAAGKARAAMDAPYSNPQTASAARMKHNACVMRARSLHRKLEEPAQGNRHAEGRHSREGSGCSESRRPASSHSRQNSKDKTQVSHSRQNSKELLVNTPTKLTQSTNHLLQSTQDEKPTEKQSHKNIEIYATLPKNKKGILSSSKIKPTKNVIEDEEYLNYERPGRTLALNRNKAKKEIEKRAKSEEKSNKKDKEFLSSLTKEKESKKAAAEKEKAEKAAEKEKKAEEKQGKKQHKIRRKLLMGGLIRRKNRSMPDLRDDELEAKPVEKTKLVSKDDTILNKQTDKNLSGYLSEGHLEFSGNPNLERSKLMRKSFYGSKMIAAKVPPPPPLRTTSQLSKEGNPIYEPQSLPYNKSDSVTYANGGMLLPGYQQSHTVNTLVTEAQIHHENSKNSSPAKACDVDVVDGMVVNKIEEPVTALPLPPYPSPHGSVVHSRQASEDFPPPPSLDMEAKSQETTFLEQLQMRKQQMLNNPELHKRHQIAQTCENDYSSQQRQMYTESEIMTRKQQNQQQIYQQQNQILTEAEHLRKQQTGFDVPPDAIRRNSASHMNYIPQHHANYPQQSNTNYPSLAQSNNYPNQQYTQQTNFQNQNHTSHYPTYQQSNSNPLIPLSTEPEIIRKQQLLTETIEKDVEEAVEVTRAIGGEVWLRELQAKQALLKNKRNSSSSIDSLENNSVKDLKSKFEQSLTISKEASETVRASPSLGSDQGGDVVDGPIRRRNSMEKELKPIIDSNKVKTGKKKNVTFCEQVVLVATAEENEDDSYIPNPILERVLRSVLNKDQTDSVLPFREVTREVGIVPLKRTDSMKSYTSGLPLTATQEINIDENQKKPKSNVTHPINIHHPAQDSRLNGHPENPRTSQDSIRLTQQSPVFSRPLTVPQQQHIASSPSNASPNSSLLRQSNPTSRMETNLNAAYYKSSNPQSNSTNQGPNYHNRSYSPQNGGFSSPLSSSSIAQMSPNLQQRSLSTSNHLPYAQHLQNSTTRNQQFQTKAIQQQTMGAGENSRYSPHPSSSNQHNPSPNNTLTHSNSSSSISSNQSNSSQPSIYPGSQPNVVNGHHPSQNQNYQLPPSHNQQSVMSNQSYLSHQASNQNIQRPSQSNGYDIGPYQHVPHTIAAAGCNPLPNQTAESRTNGAYMPVPNSNGYLNQNPSYHNQNAHNTGSLNSKMKQAMRTSPSIYQQNPSKNLRPQGVYQQDLALPEYNPPPPAPGSQKSENGVHQKVPEMHRNGPDNSYPPYQKVPNLHDNSHSRIPSNTMRQDPYQRVPNPNINPNSDNGTYQRVPNTNGIAENGTYQKVHNLQESYSRSPHDPYQRIPLSQDLNNQRLTPTSQDPYQRIPHPNDQYQRAQNPNEQYQRAPYPESNQRQDPYQRVPNPASSRPPHPAAPNSSEGNNSRTGNPMDANSSSYQRIPNPSDPNYQRLPPTTSPNGPYQRVPNPQEMSHQRPTHTDLPDSYSPYQHPPAPRNVPDKSNGMRPATSSSGSVCNLCRKKPITSPAVYCTDCDFYMSRFKPKTSTS